jgi:hypothetical protein
LLGFLGSPTSGLVGEYLSFKLFIIEGKGSAKVRWVYIIFQGISLLEDQSVISNHIESGVLCEVMLIFFGHTLSAQLA